MRLMKYLPLLLALLISFRPIPVAASDTLKIGYIEFPPFFYTAASGEAAGHLIDLAGGILDKANMRWSAKSLPASRLMNHLSTGDIDIAMLIKHPLLEGTTLYGDTPVANIELRAYWLGDKPPINSFEDMKGKRVIVLRGYGYSGLIKKITNPKNGIRYDMADNHLSAFKMLAIGRSDYVLDYKNPAERAIAQTDGLSELNSSQASRFNVFFIVSKATPNAEKILNVLESRGQVSE